jgi:uncharacterized protein YcfL
MPVLLTGSAEARWLGDHMRYAKRCCLMLSVLALTGCMGRMANPVMADRALDHNLSCQQIRHEVAMNDDQINALNQEQANQERYNKDTATSAILYPPRLFMLDKTVIDQDKLPQRTEALAYKTRSEHLIELGKKKGC